tara:strand:+ start:35 stop:697 length:663 start_codon:yes stop_codon:yes gene_type:complete
MAECKEAPTPQQLYNKKVLERIDGVQFLHPEFASIVRDLRLVMRQHKMPFIIYETYRTPARQKKLISLGFSTIRDPMKNPHVNGVAVDVLIDARAARTLNPQPISEITSPNINQGQPSFGCEDPGAYNIGVNMVEEKGKKPRTVVKDQVVLDFWNYLGKLIDRQFPDLIWGGTFNMKEGDLIGTDPPHIEYRHANRLIRGGVSRNALRAQGNPGLGGRMR